LPDAIARAVQNNLDHRVEMYETALRHAELGVSSAAMLPGLVASAGHVERDKPLGSSSYNLVTNTQNFGFSTSQDERLKTADLAFSWHVLDFGLSYVRARQSADKVLIAQESRRRVVHKLIEEVRTAYWRAYAADKMRQRLRGLEARAIAALSTSRRQTDERLTSPIAAITYRRELIEIRRTLQDLQRELVSAKIQLAALINEKPDANFQLAAPQVGSATSEILTAKPESLIATAMERRPELREVAYRRRINAHELDAALLELLPGIQLFAGTNVDSNSYLLHGNWLNWGAKASWNAMRLVQYPARREQIEAQDAALAQRDIALALAVMTQIHVSRARMAIIQREVETAKAYSTTQGELVGHIRAEFETGRVSEQTLLREELNDAVGQIRKHMADASLQSARAALLAAVGIDPPNYSETLPALENVGNAAAFKAKLTQASVTSQ
jgi:outer membrane protein TolC